MDNGQTPGGNTTTAGAQALLPEDIERAEKFRRGIGGRYDRDVDQMAAEFARCRQSHSLPGDVGIAEALASELDAMVLVATNDAALAIEVGNRVRSALTPSPCPGDAGEGE